MRPVLALFCFLPALSSAGQYTVSKGWPVGIGNHVALMQDEYRPLCKEVEKALSLEGPLNAPLACERPLEKSTELKRAKWSYLEKNRVLAIVQRLEVLLEKRWGRDAPWVESERFRTNVSKLIEAGEMSVALARVPAKPHGGEMLLLRYQRRACDPKREMDFGRVEFFSVDSENLENFQQIIGLGHPTDVFIYRGRAYFDSHSYRAFDDSHRYVLPKKQSVIYVHRMYDDRTHLRVCRLLYWDEDLKRR